MEFTLLLDPQSSVPCYQQIYAALRQKILTGQLAPRQRLPSTRALAQSLGVARSTVTQSYDQLLSEGYLQTVVGSGTYVGDQLPETLLHAHSTKPVHAESPPPLVLSAYGQRLAELVAGPSPEPSTPISFRYGRPALDQMPLGIWRQLLSRHCRRADWLDYATDPMGYGPLREAIATYLAQARAVQCHPDQILITNGTQQAISLATQLLVSPGDTVALEEPSYLSARRIFASQGANLHPIAVDGEGLDVDTLARLTDSIRLVYVTPSHQFPTGAVLSLPRRLALLAWAQRQGALLLEDDYDSEYRYGGRPIPALQGLGSGQSVLYLGTFSKVLFPALRIGYMVLPLELVKLFSRAKWLADRQVPTLEQAVLADFIAEGHLERHIRRMRSLYDQRRQTMVTALQTHFGPRATILGDKAGLHMMVRFQTTLPDAELIARAEQVGIGLISAAPQYLGKSPGHEFIFSFTELNEGAIANGIARLATLVSSSLQP
ncbi:PLP-dependent aminotransferase family protein [Nodosilinea sp. E11]|uniref:MocR-like pyridoxine biosynthesis transcription factor PdxR n=1 Tax=Nodosilinea sp. E11 TaxID=3037479 RepID=UPI002934B5C6|nr:PLP-dependent aminotransferase family protein [Nodosilinea sp. E11]WOD39823.1 PLP-dependent aminotransferase family protein [Nodosilinea sp. E11]